VGRVMWLSPCAESNVSNEPQIRCAHTTLQKVMKIISTFHPSSSVFSSIKCRLSTRDLEHLVIAKLSRIDVYSVLPQGLQHECGLDIWGKLCSIKALPISVSKRPCCIPKMLIVDRRRMMTAPT
jgi:hypothetical protein